MTDPMTAYEKLFEVPARQAVYTKRAGKLIAAPIFGGTLDLLANIRPAVAQQRYITWGPLMVELEPITGGKRKRTALGVFPACHAQMHQNIFNAIRGFAGARTTPAWVAELDAYRVTMRPSVLRALFMGFILRRRIRPRDLARIEA